jgi:uncharacterized membrane protein YczE
VLDNNQIKRTTIAGAVLALLGVAMFIGLWVMLGNTDTSQFARILLSLCIPPIVMAAGVGLYFLLVRSSPGAS